MRHVRVVSEVEEVPASEEVVATQKVETTTPPTPEAPWHPTVEWHQSNNRAGGALRPPSRPKRTSAPFPFDKASQELSKVKWFLSRQRLMWRRRRRSWRRHLHVRCHSVDLTPDLRTLCWKPFFFSCPP